MFRVYRVTGGDDTDINVRKFASRYLIYLILRAIGTLTATTTDPRDFVTRLQDADDLTVNFEGHAGGAWHKVIRWSFEKQGLFQLPGAPTQGSTPRRRMLTCSSTTAATASTALPYQLGASPGCGIVWPRTSAPPIEPAAGVTNYLYVASTIGGRLQANASGQVLPR